jgi:hypothetical protein
VKPISWRVQLGFIAVGYGAVLAIAGGLILIRYLQEASHPADVAGAGGMYAAGDLFLGIFIVCLFMIPSFFLVRLMAGFEGLYTRYSQLMLGMSVSAPVCLMLIYWGENRIPQNLALVGLYRLLWSPFIIVGLGASWLVARFSRARTLIAYSLLIETLTLGVAVALLFVHRR